MPTKPVKVAIYLRVSKDDGSQEPDNHLLQLRGFCKGWDGHELVTEYVDRESGTRGRRERTGFDRVFADAARRRFDVLLFWALDRFSREGIRPSPTSSGSTRAGSPTRASRSPSWTPTTS
ncbi:MAG: recombinase family protein [Actinomycetota bacterium]|nr:recombinase family protein [Actinomycetota bacterium]